MSGGIQFLKCLEPSCGIANFVVPMPIQESLVVNTRVPAGFQVNMKSSRLESWSTRISPDVTRSIYAVAAMFTLYGANGRRKKRRGVGENAQAQTHLGSPVSEDKEKSARRKTRTVFVGNVPVGSDHPIATQTMTTTLTHDVEATVAQVKKCADAGIDIVRVTVQGMREARACEHIQRRLREDGCTTPIVADIHFTPKVALAVADFVDKVRVNPGNFTVGRKSFDTISSLTDEDIRVAREEIEKDFVPLVLKLKAKGKALRIGVNHGSLSERILFQYGDTPEGMVASALEFGEICRKHDYHNIVFSMKSSNPVVMVRAYRELVREMYRLGWDYPLHLGVTEAGSGSDGRIKSAVGMGALLLDGLGDTVRVSLTEDPEFEAEPCKVLRKIAKRAENKDMSSFQKANENFSRRPCDFPLDVPLNRDGSVFLKLTEQELRSLDMVELSARLGLHLRKDGKVQKDHKSVDAIVIEEPFSASPGALDEILNALVNVPIGVLCPPGEYVPHGATLLHKATDVTRSLEPRVGGHALIFTGTESAEVIEQTIQFSRPRLILLKPDTQAAPVFAARRFFSYLSFSPSGKAVPVIFWFRYPNTEGESLDHIIMRGSSDFGSLFVDGLGEGALWEAGAVSPDEALKNTFDLLQASRMRFSKTEFISCPSCGRTLFNLQETSAMIQARTGHLPGLRIAVMGCIVNGPGEMADADFGYVGSGAGKVDLYVGYKCVKRGIPSKDSVDKLIDLIKEHDRWEDPPEAVAVETEQET